METPVRCQLFHSNETSPFAACCVAPRIGLAHFRALVERFAPKFRAGGIRYLDDEGDQITIETDIELEEALKLGQKLGVLKVMVDGVKVETPAPAPAVQVPVKEEAPVVPPATAAPKVVHRAICDSCRKYIAGIRYKCVNCPDYDLCESCEELFGKQEEIHPQDHVFLKIRRPICPHHRLAIPNLYEPAVRRPCIANRRCAFPRPASVTVNAAPAPAPAPATPNHEERISALEATVAQLAQELSTVTDEKKKIEERKKAQEQKRKELKEQLQKKNEERAAIKAERKLKKVQQMEANRLAAQARQAARQAKQVAVAQTRTVIEVPVKVDPAPAPVQEPVKVEEVVELKVEVSEPVQIVHVEEIPQQEEEKAQEQQEATEEEKKDDDFVVISEEAPAEQEERRSYFKEALEILGGMGFSDIDRNLHLLAHFAGDVHAVITALLEVA